MGDLLLHGARETMFFFRPFKAMNHTSWQTDSRPDTEMSADKLVLRIIPQCRKTIRVKA
jgi:hypothetical protein